MEIDPFVALKSNQPSTSGRGEGPRDLGLPHPCLPLQQQRLAERHGQMDRERQGAVCEVALGAERVARRLNRSDLRNAHAVIMAARACIAARAATSTSQANPAACSRALRHSTRDR